MATAAAQALEVNPQFAEFSRKATAIEDFVVFWSLIPTEERIALTGAMTSNPHGCTIVMLLWRIIQEWRQ